LRVIPSQAGQRFGLSGLAWVIRRAQHRQILGAITTTQPEPPGSSHKRKLWSKSA
jgi:hypothetical protein